MALPVSRNTTYTPKAVNPATARVKSADLNDIQDWIIAAFNRTVDIGISGMRPDNPDRWEVDDHGETGSSGGTSLKMIDAAGDWLRCSVPLAVGDRIVSYTVYVLEIDVTTDADRTHASWRRITMGNGLSQEDTDGPDLVASTGSAGMATIVDADVSSDYFPAKASGERFEICIHVTTEDVQVFGIQVVIDHPTP